MRRVLAIAIVALGACSGSSDAPPNAPPPSAPEVEGVWRLEWERTLPWGDRGIGEIYTVAARETGEVRGSISLRDLDGMRTRYRGAGDGTYSGGEVRLSIPLVGAEGVMMVEATVVGLRISADWEVVGGGVVTHSGTFVGERSG